MRDSRFVQVTISCVVERECKHNEEGLWIKDQLSPRIIRGDIDGGALGMCHRGIAAGKGVRGRVWREKG